MGLYSQKTRAAKIAGNKIQRTFLINKKEKSHCKPKLLVKI